MDFDAAITARIDSSSKVFTSSRPAPMIGQIPIYDDISTSMKTEVGVNVWYGMQFASIYGVYNYAYLNPHSFYWMSCCGFSLFCLMVTMNHWMMRKVGVADAAVLADGL